MASSVGTVGVKRKRPDSREEEKDAEIGVRRRRPDNDGEDKETKGKYEEVFLSYKKELNARYDAQERLVKLSRDVTIQSKRVIFNLHQFSGTSEESKKKVLSEAETKIQKDIVPKLRSIAMELRNKDPYEFIRSYTIGVQEFIEAFTFLHYLKSGRLVSYDEIQKFLSFPPKENIADEPEKQDASKDPPPKLDPVVVLPLSRADFLLGVADLTGELMRLCINAVGSGNTSLPFHLLSFMRTTWRGFLAVDTDSVKYMGQKMSVMKASLCKVENVCYSVKIRGSELPKNIESDISNEQAEIH